MKYLIISWILILSIPPKAGVAQQCFQRVVKEISHSQLNEDVEIELEYRERKAKDHFLYFTDSFAYSQNFFRLSNVPIVSNISGNEIYRSVDPSENGGLYFKKYDLKNELLYPPSWTLTGRKKDISGYLCEEMEVETTFRRMSKVFHWVTRSLPNHEFVKGTTPINGMVLESEFDVKDRVGNKKGTITIQYEIKKIKAPQEFTFAINEVNKMLNFKQDRINLLSGNEIIDSNILMAVNAIPKRKKKLVIDEGLVPENGTGLKTKSTYVGNWKSQWSKYSEDGTKSMHIDYRYSPPDTQFISIDTTNLSNSFTYTDIFKYHQDTLCRVFKKNPILDNCWLLLDKERIRKSFQRQDNIMIPKVDYYYNENLLLTRVYYHEYVSEVLYKYNQKGQKISVLELPRNREQTFEYFPNGLRWKECGESGCYVNAYGLKMNIDDSFIFTEITTQPDGKETKLIQEYDDRHNLIKEIKIDKEGKQSETRYELEYY